MKALGKERKKKVWSFRDYQKAGGKIMDKEILELEYWRKMDDFKNPHTGSLSAERIFEWFWEKIGEL